MLKPGTKGSAVSRWPAELFWTSSRPAAIAALSFVFPASAFADCVLQPDGVTAVCDTSAPNPFPSSVNANPTAGGTVTIPTTGASVIDSTRRPDQLYLAPPSRCETTAS